MEDYFEQWWQSLMEEDSDDPEKLEKYEKSHKKTFPWKYDGDKYIDDDDL